MNPLVSVIVPNYNHAQYLAERIDSILSQDYTNFEVILMDDHSKDNSIEILNRYKENSKVTHILINSTNSGSSFKQWLKGIEAASGEYIWIAESDDVASPEFLSTLMNEMYQDEEITMTYCKSQVINSCGEAAEYQGNPYLPDNLVTGEFSISFIKDGNQFIQSSLILENSVPNASAVLFRKDAFEKIDKSALNEYQLYGDWLCWIMLSQKGKVCFLSEVLNKFRIHEGTVRKLKSNELSTLFEHIRLYSYLSRFFSEDRKLMLDRIIYKYQTYFKGEIELSKRLNIHWSLWKLDILYPFSFGKDLLKNK